MPRKRHEGTTVEPGKGPVVFLDALCAKIPDECAVRNKAIDLTCRESGRRTNRPPPPASTQPGKWKTGLRIGERGSDNLLYAPSLSAGLRKKLTSSDIGPGSPARNRKTRRAQETPRSTRTPVFRLILPVSSPP